MAAVITAAKALTSGLAMVLANATNAMLRECGNNEVECDAIIKLAESQAVAKG